MEGYHGEKRVLVDSKMPRPNDHAIACRFPSLPHFQSHATGDSMEIARRLRILRKLNTWLVYLDIVLLRGTRQTRD